MTTSPRAPHAPATATAATQAEPASATVPVQFVPAHIKQGPPTPRAWRFGFHDGHLVVPSDAPGDLGLKLDSLPCSPGEAGSPSSPTASHFLGTLDGLDVWADEVIELRPGEVRVPLRAAMMQLPQPLSDIAGRAAQIVEWARSHRFCGACATPTQRMANERAMRCPACGRTFYPRHSPVAMALVWRDRQLLLARSPHFAPGMFSALAGFAEAGESLEECLHREVLEEVGVQVADLRYFSSQSWPFPHSMMVAYTARWTGGDIVPQPGEIEQARWFDIHNLPTIPRNFSIAGQLIRASIAAVAHGRTPGEILPAGNRPTEIQPAKSQPTEI